MTPYYAPMIMPRKSVGLIDPTKIPFAQLTPEQQRRRMLGFPATATTNVYKPTMSDLDRMRRNGVVEPVAKIIERTNGDETVAIAVNGDGKVLDVETKAKLTPLQMGMLAVGAFLLFGG